MSCKTAIGIDLGTTNSCVGVFRDGKVHILANEMGSRLTPSYVAFDGAEVLVGQTAKDQIGINPLNTVYEVKRLIGRKLDDSNIMEYVNNFPFRVSHHQGSPRILVNCRGTQSAATPETISGLILAKLAKMARDYTGEVVTDVVITVPAFFNDTQRQATIDAAKQACLNVRHLINEPTAAALAYGYEKKFSNPKNILVYDLGGATFDVALLSIKGNDYVVKAVGGDSRLGGCDFDLRLMKYVLDGIKSNFPIELSSNPRALVRLRKACIKTKIALSGASTANLIIENLMNGHDYQAKITREVFQTLCSDLFQQTIGHVEKVLHDSKMDKATIDEVILVGGSSRIPKIREMLSEFFGGKKLNATINPDECVAYGATLKAAQISGCAFIEKMTVADVIPLTLGQDNYLGDMVPFIYKNTPIPITVVQDDWTTVTDYQSVVRVRIYEGEDSRVEKNNLLGVYHLSVAQRALAGVPKFRYIFTVDENGILQVSGENLQDEAKQSLVIKNWTGRFIGDTMAINKSQQDVEGIHAKQLQTGSAGTKKVDMDCSELTKDATPHRDVLKSYCHDMKNKAVRCCLDDNFTVAVRSKIVTVCDGVLAWLDLTVNAKMEDYISKLSELKFFCNTLVPAVTGNQLFKTTTLEFSAEAPM